MPWPMVLGGWIFAAAVAMVTLGTIFDRTGRSRTGTEPAGPPAHADEQALLVPTVVAHGALQAVDVIVGALATIEDEWDRLDQEQRDIAIARARQQSDFLSGLLTDLLQDLPVPVTEALDNATLDERTVPSAP